MHVQHSPFHVLGWNSASRLKAQKGVVRVGRMSSVLVGIWASLIRSGYFQDSLALDMARFFHEPQWHSPIGDTSDYHSLVSNTTFGFFVRSIG